MQLPDIPPRALLAFRVASFIFGITSIALSAASIQITRTVPRPATGDNIFLIIASAFGLITTAYRIATYKLNKRRNEQASKRRFFPVATETIVIAILLAAFIYGAVTTSRGGGACHGTRGEVGDGDEAGEGGAGTRSGRACALTKASTSFTAANFATFVASTYTVGKAVWDEKH